MRTNIWFSCVKLLIVIVSASCCAELISTAEGASTYFPEHEIEKHNLKRHPGKIAPNPFKSESEYPDLYMEQGMKLGLKKFLPEPVNKNVGVTAGYDNWKKIPTAKIDYFMPIKVWPDRTFFFQPRLNLDITNESLSLGLGYRQILTPELMVGVHAFHDWMRPRLSDDESLKEVGVGLEFSALPGGHSDLTFSANLYLPINEKTSLGSKRDMMVLESLPAGFDAKTEFLLPAMVDFLDIKLEGKLHSYKGRHTDMSGYTTGLVLKTRDGMLNTTLEYGRDTRIGEHYKIQGNLSLKFDWAELFGGKNPFSPPYKSSPTRYTRKMRDSLHDRAIRKYDLPADKVESRYTLMADMSEDMLFISGGFADLPNSTLSIQTSQSPWQDFGEVATNEKGAYSTNLRLDPGIYQLRLIHKPTGRVSNVKTVVVSAPQLNKE
jgi:hypothetical protein